MDSSKVRPTMLGLVGIGLSCAAFFPAMKISVISIFGSIPMEFSLREAMNALVNTGRGWAVALAAIGVIMLVINVLGYDAEDKGTSRRWLTIGAVLTLLFPFNLLRAMDSVVADVVQESDGMAMADTSLALGLIIPSIAFIAVAGLAWYAVSQERPAQASSNPPSTLYTPPTSPKMSSFTAVHEPAQSNDRPKWMTESGNR